ncbi:MAG: nucleotidyltransferase family protein [Duncaniella sp.]|nr:nucleotidyltransferase family protein [Bacteroides sp.]MDE5828249.1 nucleotidyltransferase family protein [Duncaniella sp.]MDE6429593.1 nucleotidyltransferase family protein [Duncaniella sp.]MDE6812428.1 nucleotidyltransferase family protein [Duncaniella sp.]MDE7476104.1 nucleotidyltransferase family protein [Duncaniella sp.]
MFNSTDCIKILTDNLPRIQSEFGVTGLWIFGSVARGDNRPDSDIDILVEMPPKIFLLSALKDFLENILHTSVDLIRRHSNLSSKFIEQINQDAIPIF